MIPAGSSADAPGLAGLRDGEGGFGRLSPGWRAATRAWLAGEAPALLGARLAGRRHEGATIFPPDPLAALCEGGPQDVRVVILGQDPYHGPGQAHGYAFSVPAGVRVPPSLRNIRKELARDLAIADPPTDLRGWASQGVLLLNTVLTVESGQPASHAGWGWEGFTGACIDALARDPSPRVFLLWGAHAQAHRGRIGAGGHGHPVLCANHPSPLSASRPPQPFLGCGHFSQANALLRGRGAPPVDWSAPFRTEPAA
jgi:uracil-DNA glycosylase